MWRIQALMLGVTAAAVVALACSHIPAGIPPACDRVVYGACIIFYGEGAPDISQERLEAGFRASAAIWETLPSALHGFTVLVRGPDAWKLADDSAVWGITYMLFPRMDYSTPLHTCPELVLAHEWGHAGARIEGHDDTRFDDAYLQPALRRAGLDGC